MINKHFRQFLLFYALLSLILIAAIGMNGRSQSEQQAKAETAHRSQVHASINLLVSETDSLTRQSLSHLLTGLDQLSQVSDWHLHIGEKLLSKKGNVVDSGQLQYVTYFKTQKGELVSLEYSIRPTGGPTNLISTFEIIILLLSTGLIGVFFSLRFRWLFNIESYAKYVLTNNSVKTSRRIENSSNPISYAINQLMLTNSLLLKDKQDLTEQIRKTSFVDEVTELGNALFFKAEFEVRLHHHDEPENGLLMIFSFVDEGLGEDDVKVIDNDCLLNIANVFRHFIHDFPGALVARLRGIDFALLLPSQSRDSTDKICKKLINQLDKAVFDNTSLKENFVDIGISAYQQGFDYYKILAEADMALRNAQLYGGNNWFMYGEALPENKVRGNLKWRSFLERVLDKRQIQLYGQKVHYFNPQPNDYIEVYARIEDGDEILTADMFLPMANQCGLAASFDRQVIDGVIKHHLYNADDSKYCRYSVNLFGSSLADERFVSWLIGRLSSLPELCQHIVLEIKESHVNPNISWLPGVMNQLSKLGVKWCIDRFGSPDEDLGFLDRLPIDVVKIDRRIVHNIHKDSTQQLLLKSLIINLNNHSIEILGEGVEDKADAAYLAKVPIAGGQGYYFGKPQRLKNIEKFLKAI